MRSPLLAAFGGQITGGGAPFGRTVASESAYAAAEQVRHINACGEQGKRKFRSIHFAAFPYYFSASKPD